jgi:hypothetical protein
MNRRFHIWGAIKIFFQKKGGGKLPTEPPINICPMMQDEFLPSRMLMVFEAIEVVDGMEPFCRRSDTGRSER